MPYSVEIRQSKEGAPLRPSASGVGFRATFLAEVTTFVGLQLSYQVVALPGGPAQEYRAVLSLHRWPLLGLAYLASLLHR